jgi:hypothetical protein
VRAKLFQMRASRERVEEKCFSALYLAKVDGETLSLDISEALHL